MVTTRKQRIAQLSKRGFKLIGPTSDISMNKKGEVKFISPKDLIAERKGRPKL